jgi:hypothetical protein
LIQLIQSQSMVLDAVQTHASSRLRKP